MKKQRFCIVNQWKKSEFERLDTQLFPAFLAAAELENFTLAAQALAMTQSGVSQHVARLEDQLGVALFSRTKGRVELTDHGRMLREFASGFRDSVDDFLARLNEQREPLQGLVSYAMPESCLFAGHFAALLNQRTSDFPNVDLRVRIVPPENIHQMVAAGEVHFGFVTDSKFDDDLEYIFFCNEEYVLVSADRRQLKDLTEKTILQLPFLVFSGAEELFYLWRSIHFPRAKELSFHALNVRGHVDSMFGVVTMLAHGAGVAILPKQCTESLLANKSLFEFSNPKVKNAEHKVFIVKRKGVTYPKRVQVVLDGFASMTV